MAIILVTGCSSGFGEAIALGFAARGDIVYATMRTPSKASEALKAAGSNVILAPLDVTDPQSRAAILARVLSEQGRLDCLVNNAGIVAFGSMEDMPEQVSRQLFDTNYFAPVEMMRLVLPVMRKQGAGRIVNITAIGAVLSTALLGTYAATKHALDSATSVVDLEARPFGVRALSVLPGQFKTSIADKSPGQFKSAHYDGIAAALDSHRAARAADVQTDYAQVVHAVLAAATDSAPKPRYLAGIGLALKIEPALRELDKLHDYEAERAGV